MKRHRSLAPLAREHHHALVLAQQLKRDAPERLRAAVPEGDAAVIAWLRERVARELEPHFEVEERVLLPRCDAHGGELASQANTVREHHARLRAGVVALEDGNDVREQLDAWAQLLEQHVRFEEREWFVAIEEAFADELEGPSSRMPELPLEVQEYERTDGFDAESTPSGLRKSHRLEAGTWGEIVVTEGRVLYVLEDDEGFGLVLTPEHPGIVAPERPHHVTPQPGARFFVRFLRHPA